MKLSVCYLLIFSLQDYRPGTTRADLEDDQKRQRSRASLGGKSPPLTQKPSKELPSDGSYKGDIHLQELIHTDRIAGFYSSYIEDLFSQLYCLLQVLSIIQPA